MSSPERSELDIYRELIEEQIAVHTRRVDVLRELLTVNERELTILLERKRLFAKPNAG